MGDAPMAEEAVLLSFRLEGQRLHQGGFTNYYDKVPSKFADYNSRDFRRAASASCLRLRPAVRIHRQERGADALLREHRRLCR